MKIIEALKSINYKDVLARAGWTCLQVFLACFIVAAEPILDLLFKGDLYGTYALVLATALSGLSAALSALKTIVLETVRNIRSKSGE